MKEQYDMRKVAGGKFGRGSGVAGAWRAARRSGAFSLIELLVVIGVIVVLAAMTFPIMGAVKRAQALHRAKAELSQVETAIEAYKIKLGTYPPDNPGFWTTNQLYYELMGTTKNNALYQTLDGSAQISDNAAAFKSAFGNSSTVVGFMNSSKPGAGDDSPNAVKFLVRLKPAQFLAVTSPVRSTVLGSTIGGMPVFTAANGEEITPYGYNCSNPQHNPKSFDLWIDVVVGGKTNRVSNWSERPIVVYYTSPANSYP